MISGVGEVAIVGLENLKDAKKYSEQQGRDCIEQCTDFHACKCHNPPVPTQESLQPLLSPRATAPTPFRCLKLLRGLGNSVPDILGGTFWDNTS
jgi:hypothetical protein